MDEQKLKELITKWSDPDYLAHKSWGRPFSVRKRCADELEAALAESGAGRAQIDAERKIACRAIEWESCPCSDTRDALKGAIEEWRALAQPALAGKETSAGHVNALLRSKAGKESNDEQ